MSKCSWFKNADLGQLVLRLTVAIPFIIHGAQKLSAMEGTIAFFGQLGLPAAVAYLVAIVETFGGLAVLIGVFARYAGIILAINMLGAIFLVHFKNGYSLATGGYEYALTLLLASLAIAFIGSGKYAAKKGCAKGCNCTDTCDCTEGKCGCPLQVK